MRVFPGFANLFELSDPVAKRSYRGEFHRHDLALGVSRGEVTSDAPVAITWAMGADVPSDVVWTTSGSPLIVHERVLDVLQRHRFTGWSTYPVELHTRFGELVPEYIGLSIHGRCARVDLSRSTIELREYPGGWTPHFRGHYFVPDTWDGSDLFMEAPDQLGQVTSTRIVTEPVQRALVDAKVENLSMCSLPDVSVSSSIYSIAHRHLLPDDFGRRIAEAYSRAGVPRPPWV